MAGAERSLLTILREINRDRYESLVVCPCDGLLSKKLEEENIPYRISPMSKWTVPSSSIDKLLGISCIFDIFIGHELNKLKRLIKKEGCDVLITNTVTIKHGAIISRDMKIPHVWFIREILSHRSQWKLTKSRYKEITEFITKNSDKIVFNSKITENSFVSCVSSKDKISELNRKKSVLYPAIDFDFSKSKNEMDKDRKKNSFKIAVIGSIFPNKGQMEALVAFNKMHRDFPFCRLEIVGNVVDRGYFNKLVKFAKNKNIIHQVRFLNFIDDISEYLLSVDLLIVSSIVEPYGRIVLEGMLSKVPVVVTRRAGICELLNDGEDAVFVNTDSPDEISAAIVRLIKDNNLKNSIRDTGYRKAQELNNIKNYMDKLEKILESIFTKKAS